MTERCPHCNQLPRTQREPESGAMLPMIGMAMLFGWLGELLGRQIGGDVFHAQLAFAALGALVGWRASARKASGHRHA